MEHCPKCDVQLIYKPSIEICPNCGWTTENDDFSEEEDDRDSCSWCGEYHSMSGGCPGDIDDDLPF